MTERPAIEKRKPLNRAQYLQLMLDQEGRCGCGCGEKLNPLNEGVIDEHLIPLGVSGSNDLKNRRLFRKPCADAKTKGDRKDIAKVERLIARDEGTRRERRPIPQREAPWPKGQKIPSRPFGGNRRQEKTT